jgi:orotate phosphoribosyltransferase
MKTVPTSICSKTTFTLPIIDGLSIDVEITNNPYKLNPKDLFTMAARINKKRSFLFVSQLIGKHIPIDPNKGLATGALLAEHYMEVIHDRPSGKREEFLAFFKEENDVFSDESFIDHTVDPIVIGFAETATALGHSFYQAFHKASFFHTTRVRLKNKQALITFEEEHSHATSHRLFIDESMIANSREIILVDDEVTTGKTALNIIRSIQEKYPRERYTVVSILDWRTKEEEAMFDQQAKELQIELQVVSLLKGRIQLSGNSTIKVALQENEFLQQKKKPTLSIIQLDDLIETTLQKIAEPSLTEGGIESRIPFIKETGRFGLYSAMNDRLEEWLEETSQCLIKARAGGRTLCLGTGEFMYLPMKLAAKMGKDVSYQSTTRSPIHVKEQNGYGAQFGLTFPNPEDQEINQFVYNIPPSFYDEAFVFFERKMDVSSIRPLVEALSISGISVIHMVFFSGGNRDE